MPVERPWAWPLVPAYRAGLEVKNLLRDSGVLPVRKLAWPVVSIGSLSAGGAGKTPVVIALLELLTARGHTVDVLTRGYGRSGRGGEEVQPGTALAATRFGDEPVLIAARTGARVWVDGDRLKTGMLAERAAKGVRGIHLLDDGFQHRQLAREFDIALLTADDLQDALLPAGNLREPLSALRRADAVVFRENEVTSLLPQVRALLKPGAGIWAIRRTLMVPQELADARRPLVAFCGIARPRGFFAMLRDQGLSVAVHHAFRDHHRYTPGDVSRIVESCHLEGCGFITTEKDAVKLGPELREKFESRGGLYPARLDVAFTEPEAVLGTLETRLE